MKRHLDVHPPLHGYHFIYVIGQGGFGLVKLARHLSSGRYVAVKILRDASPFSPLSPQREADILRSLRHDNIVRLLEERHTRKHLFLVMELASRGSLHRYVRRQGGLAEAEARALFGQALAAVSYCHGQRVAHRDLKLGNLLLDEHMKIKLADFGLSLRLEQGTLVRGFWGTPEYCAPEVFHGEDYDAFKADVWSLGVVLFAMLEATLPFRGKNTDKLQDAVLCGIYVVPRGISPALQELLAWLLTVDASGRPSAEDARTHGWFSPGREAAQEDKEDAVALLQPLGVPQDPEAREYLAGLGLLPGTETEGTPGPQPQDPASLPKSSQSSKRPPIEDDGLALVSVSGDSMAVEVSSAQSDSSEAPSQPQQERSPTPSAAPNSPKVSGQPQQERSPTPSAAPDSPKVSGQPQQERRPAPSAAPEPASKASPSNPSTGSRVDLAEPEAAAAAREPEGAGTAATAATAHTTDTTASAQGKRQGRRGVGRRVLRFLLRACRILPSRRSGPGLRCCRVAPK
ncbi:MAP/microtubule affinity-regulating kinase 3-like [Lepus europaeus]|uniref:MAP/microtubule affinity-regulating kinase 3-like n=1 Tax=Lepus europaeus TaxID=9983 RepID=UPI002B461C36|nr:MAP/microtubule affinity-regulating kinase 3-like [Lepus europaeus]